jgi:ketosteroid isomerase-like protein
MAMGLKETFVDTLHKSDSRDFDGFLAALAPDCEWIVPGAAMRGPEQAKEWLVPFWQAFSSFRHDFDRVVDAGDIVYAEGTWQGVHDGALPTPQGELPPTGATVSFRFAVAAEGDAARLTSVRVYFDQLEFLGQLGVLPDPAAATA